jgi:hypothetical protein
MRHICKGTLVVLVAVLALGAASASSAFAAPEWYAKTSGSYGKITSAREITGKGTITVNDADYYGKSEGENVKIECEVNVKGSIEAGGVGTISSYIAGDCKRLEGICTLRTSYAVNLPWKTELYAEGTEIRQRIVSGGSGTPAWHFGCENLITGDTCNFNTSANMLNTGVGGVGAVFNSASNKTTCSQGGAEAGQVEGSIALTSPEAGVEGIEAREGAPAEWQQGEKSLTESIGTTLTKAPIRLYNGSMTVECEYTGEGTAGPGGAGTITKWTASNCTTVGGSCPKPGIVASGLPWDTELFRIERDRTDERTLTGGKGTGYTMKCAGITIRTCKGPFRSAMWNVSAGVEAVFGDEKLECESETGGSAENTQFIEATKGGKLSVN